MHWKQFFSLLLLLLLFKLVIKHDMFYFWCRWKRISRTIFISRSIFINLKLYLNISFLPVDCPLKKFGFFHCFVCLLSCTPLWICWTFCLFVLFILFPNVIFKIFNSINNDIDIVIHMTTAKLAFEWVLCLDRRYFSFVCLFISLCAYGTIDRR